MFQEFIWISKIKKRFKYNEQVLTIIRLLNLQN